MCERERERECVRACVRACVCVCVCVSARARTWRGGPGHGPVLQSALSVTA